MKHRYSEEVDVISIIYLLRKLKILMKVVLSNQQQFLLNFDESSNLKSIKFNGEQNDYLANYKKPCVSNREAKPVEIWTVGSIPIVNQILSNPKKGEKTLEPIVLGHYQKPEALSLRMPYAE